MNSAVLYKVRALAKGFSTFATLIWPFSSVNSLMDNESRFLTKGFLTLVARIQPHRGVDSLMFNKAEALPEQFLTFVTFIWPLPSVFSDTRHDWICIQSSPHSRPFSTVKFTVFSEVGALTE